MLRIMCGVSSLVLVASSAVIAQRDAPREVVHRIGFLALRPMPELLPNLSAFKDGMRELGLTRMARTTSSLFALRTTLRVVIRRWLPNSRSCRWS